ncbi:hypothetical protein PFUGPA_00111 [Plasmodium falciparum Palo Alto/Uganda]|uniref:Uncharacterized protein n=3 Tax=Plasmodium falciparum TaxID=5833 RepID=W4J8S7_PLAFP|nr:hypothetical protein PFUGPA_00111 [Plasmodium falciparum Palo Alto/Uganda]
MNKLIESFISKMYLNNDIRFGNNNFSKATNVKKFNEEEENEVFNINKVKLKNKYRKKVSLNGIIHTVEILTNYNKGNKKNMNK